MMKSALQKIWGIEFLLACSFLVCHYSYYYNDFNWAQPMTPQGEIGDILLDVATYFGWNEEGEDDTP